VTRWLVTAVVLAACNGDEAREAGPLGFDASAGQNAASESPTDSALRDAGSASTRPGASPATSDDVAVPGSAMGCVKGMYTAKARPLDMFILLDQSGSMQEDEDRWTPVTKAIKSFVSSSEAGGTGVALQYFPLGSDDAFKCQSKNYALPAVALAALPENAQAIIQSIDAHYFSHDQCCDTPEHAGTPTRPALEGAVAYMQGYMQKNPDHVGVILLATDGEPSSVCDDNKASQVAEVVKRAAQGVPAIRSYVIGIGDDEYLDEMAAPGGTGHGPFIVDGSGKRTESELLAALAEIRSEALPCDFAVTNVLDSARLNVEISESGGSARTLVNVANGDACNKAAEKGWYYDDPKAPKRVQLCPDTCRQLNTAKATSVRIVEGCETVVLL
jgi:von Willebrand factor type A domain